MALLSNMIGFLSTYFLGYNNIIFKKKIVYCLIQNEMKLITVKKTQRVLEFFIKKKLDNLLGANGFIF